MVPMYYHTNHCHKIIFRRLGDFQMIQVNEKEVPIYGKLCKTKKSEYKMNLFVIIGQACTCRHLQFVPAPFITYIAISTDHLILCTEMI